VERLKKEHPIDKKMMIAEAIENFSRKRKQERENKNHDQAE
jgi:hypothetical protein